MEAAAFTLELRQRLNLPDAMEDCRCPLCDGVLDRYSHHAATCVAGGERIQRHNAVRDLLFTWMQRAGLHPEKERPGLVLPQAPDDTQSARRRPADIYIPALVFAITATGSYARQREEHLQTAQACETQGSVVVPMAAKTTGTWDAGAAIVFRHVAQAAQAVAARSGAEAGPLHSTLIQELSITIRSYRVRAALRRRLAAVEA